MEERQRLIMSWATGANRGRQMPALPREAIVSTLDPPTSSPSLSYTSLSLYAPKLLTSASRLTSPQCRSPLASSSRFPSTVVSPGVASSATRRPRGLLDHGACSLFSFPCESIAKLPTQTTFICNGTRFLSRRVRVRFSWL